MAKNMKLTFYLYKTFQYDFKLRYTSDWPETNLFSWYSIFGTKMEDIFIIQKQASGNYKHFISICNFMESIFPFSFGFILRWSLRS